jgi:hypothetical protein
MTILLVPTITVLPAGTRGAVLVTGSHGGRYPGVLAALAGARAAIFSDAGVGLDAAGIGSLALLHACGMAAAAVSTASARIGDPEDMMARGVISHANAAAEACGVRVGMTCAGAAGLLEEAPLVDARLEKPAEARATWPVSGQQRAVVLADSAALVDPVSDRGAVIVTGSHGGLIGGDPEKALKAGGFAAFFNDAGIGMDGAGVTRLPALDARGIAAATVAADSARIGEAFSTLHDGVLSRVNARARTLGAREGMRVLVIAEIWARKADFP